MNKLLEEGTICDLLVRTKKERHLTGKSHGKHLMDEI